MVDAKVNILSLGLMQTMFGPEMMLLLESTYSFFTKKGNADWWEIANYFRPLLEDTTAKKHERIVLEHHAKVT